MAKIREKAGHGDPARPGRTSRAPKASGARKPEAGTREAGTREAGTREAGKRAGASRRAYASPLREAQREATKRQIVEAAHALLSEPRAELTVPVLAARAGVSVPTVHRHFPSRQALLEGVVAHLDSLGERTQQHVDPADFFGPARAAILQDVFSRFSLLVPPVGASAALTELRSRVTIPRRRRLVDEGIARALPTLPEPHRTWLSDLSVVLVSSAMVQTMTSYLGHSAEENAARMDWLLGALIAEARRIAETSSRPGREAKGRATRRKRGDRT